MKQLLITLIFVAPVFAGATRANDAREQAARIVAQIQRADYEGDRPAMQRGYDELKPFMEDPKLASSIRYWRGFARWRLAINGFNDAVDPKELEQNLNTALDEFKIAMENDPTFVDAKVGTISCLGFLAFMNRKDQTRAKELVGQILPLVKEADEILLQLLGINCVIEAVDRPPPLRKAAPVSNASRDFLVFQEWR